jgi:predicted nucleotidyltransferase
MNTEVQRDTAIQKLREVITPGATIYVVLRRKNQLGTCRWLEFYHVHDGELKRITWDVALAIQCEYCREHDAVKVTGSGLDVGFASVDSLGDALFSTGRALKHRWL